MVLYTTFPAGVAGVLGLDDPRILLAIDVIHDDADNCTKSDCNVSPIDFRLLLFRLGLFGYDRCIGIVRDYAALVIFKFIFNFTHVQFLWSKPLVYHTFLEYQHVIRVAIRKGVCYNGVVNR